MHRILITAIIFFASWSSYADVTQLDDIVVTASRYAEPSQRALHSTTTLRHDDIQAMQAGDVTEVLQRIPGLQIGRNGGPGQASSLFMRGTASDHTLIILDGVPLQSGTTGATALQHLMPEHIQRIEVSRGAASTLYGSSAIGGVVQIFTRPRDNASMASLSAGLGSDDTSHVSTLLRQRQGDVLTSFGVSRRSTNGYPSRQASTMDRGYQNHTLQGAFGIDFDNSSLEVTHFQTQGVVEYLDFFLNPVDHDAHNSVSRFVYDQVFSDAWDSRLLVSRTLDKMAENQSNDYADTVRDSLDWQHNISLGDRHNLVTGVTLSNQRTELLSFGTRYDETDQTVEFYLHDTWRHQAMRLQGGARLTEHERYGQHVTWSAAAGYQLDSATHLHANLGTAFRTPSANDLYGFGGNPAFEPESAINSEIGLRYQFSPKAKTSLTGYYTEIDDLIESDPVTYTIEQVEKARIQGMELSYQQQLGRWNWSFDYVYQDAINLDQKTDLPRRAQNKINTALRYQVDQSWLALQGTYASERQDSRFSDISLAPYTTWDIQAVYPLNQTSKLKAKLHNVFDEHYELASGYPAQGRFIGLELQYVLN